MVHAMDDEEIIQFREAVAVARGAQELPGNPGHGACNG